MTHFNTSPLAGGPELCSNAERIRRYPQGLDGPQTSSLAHFASPLSNGETSSLVTAAVVAPQDNTLHFNSKSVAPWHKGIALQSNKVCCT
jgi:hypothetical protein